MRFLPLLLLSACATAGADPSTGATEVRKVDSFHGIDLAGVFSVEARIDSTSRVEVFAEPPELLARITTTVKDGTLVLDLKPGAKLPPRSKLRAIVSAPTLDALSISGTGELRASGLGGDKLLATVAGTGALQLAGKVQRLKLTVAGTGEIRAKDLTAATVMVDVSGTGDATVTATDNIDAQISGTGAIRVHGRPPTVRKVVSGTGVIDLR